MLVVLEDAGVFKHLTSGTLGKKRRSVKKKRDACDFCKGNMRQLFYRKFAKGRFYVIQ
jgi:hypothetical protein